MSKWMPFFLAELHMTQLFHSLVPRKRRDRIKCVLFRDPLEETVPPSGEIVNCSALSLESSMAACRPSPPSLPENYGRAQTLLVY